jgi:putative ABC transport system permease protein
MTLLTGAALLIHTAWDIDHVDPGFDSRDVLTAQLLLPAARYPDLPSSAQAFRAVLDAVGATPGVRSASFTSSVPLAGAASAGIGAEGQPMTDGERLIVSVHVIAPDYFSTMGIPLHAGRDFRSSDNASAPNVTIITEALARRLWPGQRALGRRMEGMDPSHQHFMEVIGIAADQRDVSLDQAPAPMFYIPYEQTPPPLWSGLQGSLTLVVRTASSPRALEGAIRRAVDGVDPDLPLANVSTMDDAVRASLSTGHFNTLLLSVLGAIALVLASVGVYGVIAYSVSQRTREIGVRIALGSSPMIIAALILKRGLVPIVSGIVAGAVLSMFATRLLREQLYGVAPGDPFTLVAIAAVLLLVSLVAIYVPSRRAMRISPVMALTS